jgi:hypothetical protein
MEDGEFIAALGKRERFLEELLAANVRSMDEVQMRVLRFLGYEVVADDDGANEDGEDGEETAF